MNTTLNYGAFIKERRKQLGITQNQLAEALHCTPQAISKYENGKTDIFSGLLGDLAKILEVDLDSLVECKNEKHNDFAEKYVFSEKKLAQTLCYLREKTKKAQGTVSKELNIPQNKLSKWECAHSIPDINELKTLADYYKLSISSLYYGLMGEENTIHSVSDTQSNSVPISPPNPRIKYLLFLLAGVLIILIVIFSVLLFRNRKSVSSDSSFNLSSTETVSSPSSSEDDVPVINSFEIVPLP
jgi:transcriptional regulator with XRE-family HTH domain